MANENARAASGAVARHPQSASLATTSTTLPATSPASASTATESAITATADRASTPKTHAARAPSKTPTSAPARAPRSAPAPTGRERRARIPRARYHEPRASAAGGGVTQGQRELEPTRDAGVVAPPDDDPMVVQAGGLLKVPRERRID